MTTTTTPSHYEAHSAESYEEAYFYEPGAYMEHLADLTSDRLKLKDRAASGGDGVCRMLDLGGGTGNFAKLLLERHASLSLHVTVVDPFLDPTSKHTEQHDSNTNNSTSNTTLQFVKAPAEDLLRTHDDDNDGNGDDAEWKRTFYDMVLLKEVAHHFDAADRVGIFRGIYQVLKPQQQAQQQSCSGISSTVLIITRPQIDIDYPIWNEARQVWKDNQPSVEEFCSDLKAAGFVNISHSVESYPCEIALTRWQSMIKGRFWSTFSNFTDDDLNIACERISQDYQDRIDEKGMIHFEDRLVFISARKE